MMAKSWMAAVCLAGACAVSARAEIPVSPTDAVKRMTLPPGFQATLFAGEPDVVQPIAFCFDDRGRLFVAQGMTYPHWVKDAGPGGDSILIFEDTDGDGKFDKRTVFADHLSNLSGLEWGCDGLFYCATPYFGFIPDRNHDDKPDGPPQVLLDGWNIEKAGHNVVNGLVWGPDGWLYGLNGIQSESLVGAPGTANDQRVRINCGVWRWHPTRHQFEVVVHGTTNPWGLDFNDRGQGFFTNCVIAHAWQMIPGAHFERMYGQDYNPYVYSLMKSETDHLHWQSSDWTKSRSGQEEYGGGHAHVGSMVYLGDNWPDAYRNTLFTCNIHGNRVNNDSIAPRGSGYVIGHRPDFMLANDTWFRGLKVAYGPDGGVFVSDWNDTGECHDVDDVISETGRIFKITYGKAKKLDAFDLSKSTDSELIALQSHKNEWFVRKARRLLQERAASGRYDRANNDALWRMASESSDVVQQLRGIWTLHAVGALDERLPTLLDAKDEYVRGWAIQLSLEDRSRPLPPERLEKLVSLAKSDPSPVVRLFLASALQRLPLESRWELAEALAAHGEDAADLNLPLMVWYGVEPLAPTDKSRALKLMAKTKIPVVREYIARRLAAK